MHDGPEFVATGPRVKVERSDCNSANEKGTSKRASPADHLHMCVPAFGCADKWPGTVTLTVK